MPTIFITFSKIIENQSALDIIGSLISKAYFEHKYIYKKMLIKVIENTNKFIHEESEKVKTQGEDIEFLEIAIDQLKITIS